MLINENKDFNNTIQNFYEYLSSVLKHYRDTVPLLKEELLSIQSDDIDTLNEKLKSQQVLMLQTKNFKRDIDEYMARLNITANNLSSMIFQFPEKEQLRFYALLGDFELTAGELEFYREKCRIMLQSKLYVIDRKLALMTNQMNNTTYGQDAEAVHNSVLPKSFETTI